MMTFAGVSVRVTVGGTTTVAIPIVVLAPQVSAILPSSTPVGAGTVTLTYNGQTSAPFAIEVVANAFGMFGINQAGTGPGVFTDPNWAVNTLLNSAAPGSVWIIWGTGLGAVQGDEAGGALPGAIPNLDVQVIVGGQSVTVTYAGRSGCCAGLDQIAFVVPVGVTGCYVPVVVIVDDVPSNTVTISIAEDGLVCSDPAGITQDDLNQAQSQGNFSVGVIDLDRATLSMTAPPPIGAVEITADTGAATFERYDSFELITAQSITGVFPPGSCFVYTFQGEDDIEEAIDSGPADPVQPQMLDAGQAIDVTGPLGTKSLTRISKGIYSAALGGGIAGFGQPLYLTPGNYVASNGTGGTDVGSFQAQLSIPTNFVWTGRGNIHSVPSGQPLTITWEGPNAGYVYMMGISLAASSDAGAAFICLAAAADKQFTVPAYVIDSLPPSEVIEGIPAGVLSVGLATEPTRFDAPGLDVGFIKYSVTTIKNLPFQ